MSDDIEVLVPDDVKEESRIILSGSTYEACEFAKRVFQLFTKFPFIVSMSAYPEQILLVENQNFIPAHFDMDSVRKINIRAKLSDGQVIDFVCWVSKHDISEFWLPETLEYEFGGEKICINYRRGLTPSVHNFDEDLREIRIKSIQAIVSLISEIYTPSEVKEIIADINPEFTLMILPDLHFAIDFETTHHQQIGKFQILLESVYLYIYSFKVRRVDIHKYAQDDPDSYRLTEDRKWVPYDQASSNNALTN